MVEPGLHLERDMTFSILGTGNAWAQEAEPDTVGELQTETGVVVDGTHDDAFPPFDPSNFASQLVWLAITFGIFYVLVSRIIIPRIGGILETRRDRISQDIDEAQRLREESDAALAAYEHELAEARNRAHAIGQNARDEAKKKADAERERVEAELSEKLAEAEKQIDAIKQKAMAEVDGIATTATEAIVKQLIDDNITKAELSKAVAAAAKGGEHGV
jgi:F-type H+-transporting ATPase subunit b